MKQQWLWVLYAGVTALIGVSFTTVQAQEQQAVTIALPPFAEAIVDEAIVAGFEEQYGIPVEFVYDAESPNLLGSPTVSDDVEAYASDVETYMESADVLLVDIFLTPELTRAGYVLDLNPLISADTAVNPNDFYSAVWDSYMWDAGMWAMPIASQPLLLDYNIDAFNEAGLTYPNASWGLADFEFAARALTQFDENGDVEVPGMLISGVEQLALFRALLGRGFYDGNAFPDTPFLNDSTLVVLLEQWNELIDEGIIRVGGGGGFGGQNNDIGIEISSGGDIAIFITDDETGEADSDFGGQVAEDGSERGLAPMPNEQSALLTTGLAISSGTTIPDVAYNLVRYLSEQQAFADLIIGAEPARRAYFTESIESGALVFSFGDNRSEQEQALVNEALDFGLPMSELRFARYLDPIFGEIQSGTDAVTALQEAEIDAVATVQAMDDLEITMTVTSGLPIALTDGGVLLDFGYQSFVQPLPNEAEWDEAINEFVANDPEIGAIDLDIINLANSLLGTGDTETYDCTYYPNTLFADIDDQLLLALDPLLFSDPNYDASDLPFGAIELVQLNGITYGLPITIQPQLLQYNPETFAQAGLAAPIGGWSITEFGDALEALDLVLDEETAPFTATGFDNTYLLMLVAAQGGLPIDTRISPPAIDFTSPESLNAVQLILDWVDAGYIDQGSADGAGGGAFFGGGTDGSPIQPTFFGGFSNPDLSFTTYPEGTGYTPTSFDVGAGYISIDSDVPEACFRWLSFISRRPELFVGAMPAQISLLDRPEVQESLSPDAVEAYRTVANQMAAPDAVNFNATDPFLSTWLTRATEAYLLQDADLENELVDAQQYTLDYLNCTADIEFELSVRLLQELQGCVQEVDSAIID